MSRSFPMLVALFLAVGAFGVSAPVHASVAGNAVLAQADDVAAKVKTALKADADLSGPSEGVTVTGAAGLVTLEGTVPSVQLRARIAELAMKVEGVTKLVNKLKLAKK
ncbi:MAG: BON domain-containing protein [Vicinamibacterales bacterium]